MVIFPGVFDGEEEVAEEHLYVSAVYCRRCRRNEEQMLARAITEIDAGDIRAFDLRERERETLGAFLSTSEIRSACIILACTLEAPAVD